MISTGSGGGSTGNISWGSGADLDFNGLSAHSLTLQTDPSDTGREVDIEAGIHDSANNPGPADQLSLNVLTGGSDGLVTLTYVMTNGGAVNVTSGAAGIKLASNNSAGFQLLATNGGSLGLTGNVLLETDAVMDTTVNGTGVPYVGGNLSIPAPSTGTAGSKTWFSLPTTAQSVWAATWGASTRTSATSMSMAPSC